MRVLDDLQKIPLSSAPDRSPRHGKPQVFYYLVNCHSSEFRTRFHHSPRETAQSVGWEFFRDAYQIYVVRGVKTLGTYPDFQQKHAKKSPCVDGFCNTDWHYSKLQRIGLAHAEVDVDYDRTVVIRYIKSCGKKKDISTIRTLYANKNWDIHDIVIANTLIRSFARCGALREAREVFEQLAKPDVVSWNALIAGYADQEFGEEALLCFQMMLQNKVTPTLVTYISALKACAIVKDVETVEKIHAQLREKVSLLKDIVLASTLLNAYARCGAVRKAREVFDQLAEPDVVSWTALIAGFVEHGFGNEALACFREMQRSRVKLNSVTYTCALKACAIVGALEIVQEIHVCVRQQMLLDKDILLGNTLVHAYARCGAVLESREVFDQLPDPDVVSWNALITGYTEQGSAEEALACFREMQSKRVNADSVTYTCVLKACAIIGAVQIVEEIHARLKQEPLLNGNIVLESTLINAYARCGAVKKAREVFEQIAEPDVVSWNALIAGYTKVGSVYDTLELFHRMMSEGICPSPVTFVVLLNGCSHGALLRVGLRLFSMIGMHDLPRTAEHYTCMVDLFGRSGRFDEAKRFMLDNNTSTLLAFLGACQKWVEVGNARWAFEKLLGIDRKCVGAYVHMSNIFAAAGMMKEAAEVELLRVKEKAWKEPARSWWIDGSGNVHSFLVADQSHPQSVGLYSKLEELCQKLRKEGHSPDMHWVWTPAMAEQQQLSCGHSEMLAIACALINTQPHEPISISKNTRVCGACHATIVLIAKMEQRVIRLVDSDHVHAMENGRCSCCC